MRHSFNCHHKMWFWRHQIVSCYCTVCTWWMFIVKLEFSIHLFFCEAWGWSKSHSELLVTFFFSQCTISMLKGTYKFHIYITLYVQNKNLPHFCRPPSSAIWKICEFEFSLLQKEANNTGGECGMCLRPSSTIAPTPFTLGTFTTPPYPENFWHRVPPYNTFI